MKMALPLAIVFVSSLSFAGEQSIPWNAIKDASERYLSTHVSQQSREAMCKKMDDRTQQRVEDTDLSEDQAAGAILFDWASANQGSLQRMEPKAVTQLCFYVVTFLDRGYYIPSAIRGVLTPAAVNKFLNHLENEIKIKNVASRNGPVRAG